MAPASAPVARFDDLRSGWSRELRHPVGVLAAGTMAEVPEVLRAAELAARQGNWVAGFVAYEAGAAFDPALPVRPGLQGPFAWFTVCATAAAVPPIDRLEASAPSVAALDRLGGSDWFRAGVTDIRGRIAAGDVYQVNLTDSFAAPFDGDPLALYAALARAQRGSYHAYLDLGGTVIASASPELFVRWTDGVLESRPMKGTRPRGPDAAADAALATELHASAKDRAENVMIVDLIRNDLSRLAELGSVEVPELFAIERYETVWQMTSTVRCRPRAEVGLADVFAAMFPCGSVTGAPKVAAMRIIDELEPFAVPLGFAPPAGPVRRHPPESRMSSTAQAVVRGRPGPWMPSCRQERHPAPPRFFRLLEIDAATAEFAGVGRPRLRPLDPAVVEGDAGRLRAFGCASLGRCGGAGGGGAGGPSSGWCRPRARCATTTVRPVQDHLAPRRPVACGHGCRRR